MIDYHGLAKSFGDVDALRGVSLQVEAGECVGLIGPNGAGKTTTLKILATLTKPDEGRARVGGWDVVDDPREVRRLVGFMPDVFNSYGDLAVRHLLEYYASLVGLRGDRRKSTVADVLDLVDLSHKADSLVHGLSRGVKQRLCLAKTLLHDPAVLLLDEPASGLDPRARIEIRALLQALRGMGKTILISSHILEDLEEICDRVAIVESGKYLTEGSVDHLKSHFARGRRIRIRVRGGTKAAERAAEVLAAHPLVVEVLAEGENVFATKGDDVDDLSPAIGDLIGAGVSLVSFVEEEAKLEHIFLEATKGEVS